MRNAKFSNTGLKNCSNHISIPVVFDFIFSNDRKFNETVDKTSYELPDKSLIVLSKEIYTLPELFFQQIVKIFFLN